jgi:starch phosphorylase
MLKMKKNMSIHLRRRYTERMKRIGSEGHHFPSPEEIVDDQCLTLGFSRRFAPYKRATLMFRDMERLKRILNTTEKPVQVLFSGKAHPHNEAGKALIQQVNKYAQEEGLRGKIVFIEDYSINVSRSLVSGVDVWLNTPRRPLEASGTSGQKVPINGGINFSILDGWWPEGYNGQNGWAIGSEIEYSDQNLQDEEDGKSFYEILENEIIPLYYDQDKKGLPHGWIKMAKESLRSNLTKFSTHTMVWNYNIQYYVPGMKRHIKYTESDFAGLFKFFRWSNRINRHWKNLRLFLNHSGELSEDVRICGTGESKEVSVLINMVGIEPEDLNVEVTMERQFSIKGHQHMITFPMGFIGEARENQFEYRALIKNDNGAAYRFNCRVMPKHPDLFNAHETRLIKWLD